MTAVDLVSTSLSRGELRRLAFLFVIAVAIVATLAGSAVALETCFGLGKFGGLDYVPRVIALAGARELGPGSSAAGALYAFFIWSQRVPAVLLRAEMRRVGPPLAVMSIPGALFAVAVFIGAGLAIAHVAFDVPFSTLRSVRSALDPSDIGAGLGRLALAGALASLYCWFALPPMTKAGWSVPRKIAVTCVVNIALKLTLTATD